MPRVRTPEIPLVKMRRLLLGYGFNGPKLAKVIGCSDPTARRRLDDPSELTLGDIMKINRTGHVPMEELRAAITLGGTNNDC